MKTTIDKQGKQITVEIGSRWMIEWSQQSGDKQRDVAMVKATYRITFVTSKSNGIKGTCFLLNEQMTFAFRWRKLWRSQVEYICVKFQT